MAQILTSMNANALLIQSGEDPNPSVLNRPVLALMNAIAIEEELTQALIRGSSLEITDSTVALIRPSVGCTDIVSGLKPVLTGGTSDDFFFRDNFFYGSMQVGPAATNLAAYNTVIDTTIQSLRGWVLTGGISSECHIDLSSTGTTVLNVKADSTTTANGIFKLVSASFPVSGGFPLSFSVGVRTAQPLARNGVKVTVGLEYFVNTTSLGTYTCETTLDRFTGVLLSEGHVLPASTTKAVVTLTIDYTATTVPVAVTLHNLMVSATDICPVHTASSRTVTDCAYPRSICVDKDAVSVIFWAKFTDNNLLGHALPAGPLFLSSDSGDMVIGAVHETASGSSLKLKVCSIGAGGIVTSGAIVTLPATEKNKYIPCMLRISRRKNEINFVVVDSTCKVYTSSIPIPALVPTVITASERFTIKIGYGGVRTTRVPIPVAEIRYDEEWINDWQFATIALTRKPFVFPMHNESGPVGLSVESLEHGVNLISNPDARFGWYGWSESGASVDMYTQTLTAPITGLNFVQEDSAIGRGYTFSGTATRYIKLQSSKMLVSPSTNLTLYAENNSATGTTGQFGISLDFYNSSNVVITSTASYALNGVQGFGNVVRATAPAGTQYAMACMLISSGATSSQVSWCKMKLERGNVHTRFTDEGCKAHALYA